MKSPSSSSSTCVFFFLITSCVLLTCMGLAGSVHLVKLPGQRLTSRRHESVAVSAGPVALFAGGSDYYSWVGKVGGEQDFTNVDVFRGGVLTQTLNLSEARHAIAGAFAPLPLRACFAGGESGGYSSPIPSWTIDCFEVGPSALVLALPSQIYLSVARTGHAAAGSRNVAMF